MKKFLLIVLLFSQLHYLFAQKHDYFWLTGTGGGAQSQPNDSAGINILDFNAGPEPLIINNQTIPHNFHTTNSTMCDSAGNLLFYTNGVNIYDSSHQIMDNGQAIVTGSYPLGYRSPLATLSLASLTHPQQYFLFNVQRKPDYPVGEKLYYNRIDMNLNNGLGRVVEKKKTCYSGLNKLGTGSGNQTCQWARLVDCNSTI